MSTDILYPVLIALGCLLIVVVVHLLTRPKPSREDISVPGNDAQVSRGSVEAPVADLTRWHRRHEATLVAFLSHHDRTVAGHQFTATRDDDALGESIDEAIDSHPAPAMQAELAALRGAAEALTTADQDGAERHAGVYLDYRRAWLDRLWQFCSDCETIAGLRARTAELESSIGARFGDTGSGGLDDGGDVAPAVVDSDDPEGGDAGEVEAPDPDDQIDGDDGGPPHSGADDGAHRRPRVADSDDQDTTGADGDVASDDAAGSGDDSAGGVTDPGTT